MGNLFCKRKIEEQIKTIEPTEPIIYHCYKCKENQVYARFTRCKECDFEENKNFKCESCKINLYEEHAKGELKLKYNPQSFNSQTIGCDNCLNSDATISLLNQNFFEQITRFLTCNTILDEHLKVIKQFENIVNYRDKPEFYQHFDLFDCVMLSFEFNKIISFINAIADMYTYHNNKRKVIQEIKIFLKIIKGYPLKVKTLKEAFEGYDVFNN